MVSYFNKILGQIINTRSMDIGVPKSYIANVLQLLKQFHYERKSFIVKEMERITGMLIFIASSASWVKFLLLQIYLSIAAAIGDNTAYLHRTNKQFRQLLKEAKRTQPPTPTSTFTQSAAAQQK